MANDIERKRLTKTSVAAMARDRGLFFWEERRIAKRQRYSLYRSAHSDSGPGRFLGSSDTLARIVELITKHGR